MSERGEKKQIYVPNFDEWVKNTDLCAFDLVRKYPTMPKEQPQINVKQMWSYWYPTQHQALG